MMASVFSSLYTSFAVQLHGKLATLGVVYTYIPATADTEVVAFGDYMDEAFVVP